MQCWVKMEGGADMMRETLFTGRGSWKNIKWKRLCIGTPASPCPTGTHTHTHRASRGDDQCLCRMSWKWNANNLRGYHLLLFLKKKKAHPLWIFYCRVSQVSRASPPPLPPAPCALTSECRLKFSFHEGKISNLVHLLAYERTATTIFLRAICNIHSS